MNNKILYVVIGVLVLVVIGGGLYLFLGNKGAPNETGAGQPATTLPLGAAQTPAAETQTPATDKTIVDCGEAKDPLCFMGRANACLPVTGKMTSGDTKIELTVLGIENDKCHLQRKINNTMDLNCFFPKGTNIMNAVDQTFGNDHGLQSVVDAACSGW